MDQPVPVLITDHSRAKRGSTMRRRILRPLVMLLPIVAVFAGMTEAHADPYFPDPHTSVVVTRLTISHGNGWLVLQPRIGHDTAIGFQVSIPAGAGSWSGPAVVPVPELGISCVRKAEPDLDYLCGSDGTDSDSPPFLLPSGGYQISIPLSRTGSITGLTGATSFWQVNRSEGPAAYPSDSFPVVDATHFLSTAEVRNFYTSSQQTLFGDDIGDLPVTMTVVPGEQVHAVDIRLPPGDWGLLDYDFHPRIHCQLEGDRATPTIHCASLRPTINYLPGRYPYVFRLELPATEDDSAGRPGFVALTVNADPTTVQDTFGWFSAVNS